MSDLGTDTLAILGGLGLGLAFGVIGQWTRFCSNGAIREALVEGDGRRLRAWFLAIAVVVAATQTMDALDIVDLAKSIYLATPFNLATIALGGLVFGYGMMLANGCGARALVRLGYGNLRSILVVLLLALSANATLRGVLGPLRAAAEAQATVAAKTPTLPDLLAAATGLGSAAAQALAAGAVVVALLALAFKDRAFRASPRDIAAGLGIGAVVALGWALTGTLAQDEFATTPVRPGSLSIVAPSGEALQWLMIATGMPANFGIAAIGGIIAGSFATAVARGKFALEGFESREDLVRHAVGAVMMGVGGVLALGCTVGQGLTGLSTLSLGSVVAVAGIVAGASLATKRLYGRKLAAAAPAPAAAAAC